MLVVGDCAGIMSIMTLNMSPPHHNDAFYGSSDSVFGYLFSSGPEEPAPTPDAPARGQPLLNDFELDSTQQFFDKFQNDHLGDDFKLFESLGHYQHEPIPNFHGVASSLGPLSPHDADAARALNYNNFDHDLNLRFDQATLTSPQHEHFQGHVFPSASFAQYDTRRPVQTRHHSDALSTHNSHNSFDQTQDPLSRAHFGRQSAPVPGHGPGPLLFGDQSFANTAMVRPSEQRTPTISEEEPTAGRSLAPTLGFGSDQNFRNQSYNAPRPNLETLKVAEEKIQGNMRNLEEFQRQLAEATMPLSPIKSKRRLSDADVSNHIMGFAPRSSRGSNGSLSQLGDKRPRKAKLENDGRADDEATMIAKSRIMKRNRMGARSRTMSDCVGTLESRRKSQSGDKPSRQNLTEEEKKQNHIRSEQKRRNQIKDGFTNLTALMPEGPVTGTSKCAILSQAVDWLRSLIDGNERLHKQLRELGG